MYRGSQKHFASGETKEEHTLTSKPVSDKVAKYRQADAPLPDHNQLWPLYGAGLENLGRDSQSIQVPMPEYGPDELLVRHDACGLCFSDIKIIKLGEEHPRIFRRMRDNPVVMGHEVTMTVVGVGENLRDQYHVGDRFIVQADIFVGGVNYAYGYEIQGGLSRYGVIDQRILNGDDGNYLIPVQPETGYAESALTEPWACVIAAYELEYRTGLKPAGTTWIIGPSSFPSPSQDTGMVGPSSLPSPSQGEGPGVRVGSYTISAGFDETSHPDRLLLTNVPPDFAAWLNERAAALNVEVIETADLHTPPVRPMDDIIVLGADPDLVETVSPHLADQGILALIANVPMPRQVAIDVGRVHYNGWVYVGGPGHDIAQAYHQVPVRSTLKVRGRAWFVGAGGPMGRMHVQRAIQSDKGPATIVCTDVSDMRLEDLCASFGAEAEAKGIEWICLNPTHKEAYEASMARFRDQAFDDIVVLAPIPAVITDASTYLAPKGVMNIFAGVARGTMANLDLSDVYLKDVRVIGHSASTIDDLRLMLNQAESGLLSPNRSVAAIGSLSAVRDGLKAVLDTTFPGKVVIFPNIKEMPLTALSDLKEALPTVYALLKDGREWTVEAEQEFLRLMLP
jgi:threonine dehydrogenase-like Zn-dependent dehydrogenase